jgi:hypothetical protein
MSVDDGDVAFAVCGVAATFLLINIFRLFFSYCVLMGVWIMRDYETITLPHRRLPNEWPIYL